VSAYDRASEARKSLDIDASFDLRFQGSIPLPNTICFELSRTDENETPQQLLGKGDFNWY